MLALVAVPQLKAHPQCLDYLPPFEAAAPGYCDHQHGGSDVDAAKGGAWGCCTHQAHTAIESQVCGVARRGLLASAPVHPRTRRGA